MKNFNPDRLYSDFLKADDFCILGYGKSEDELFIKINNWVVCGIDEEEYKFYRVNIEYPFTFSLSLGREMDLYNFSILGEFL